MAESESLRDRLIDVGVDLLEEVGAAQLGLRAITRAAGVSHGAPRRYFPTHRALLAAIAARGFADLLDRFTNVDVTASARDRLARMSAEYIEFAARRPEMFTLMFRHDLLEGSGENLRSVTLPLFTRFTELVGAAAASDTIDPRGRAIALWTNLHGIATTQANRSLRLVEPGGDVGAVLARALEVHLA
ncbi:TetR/AcrR family transcriptional regulator [Nocardia pneumoniae]|uniref:TetR/AcrR family transcriptional regulator n=1 Tax=Nocardia pneumoniae TaxID=228601 RepID=UPI0002D3AA15|nr:TetR/AcrR family transcriptional regulator [Nocardia pneumoniae]